MVGLLWWGWKEMRGCVWEGVGRRDEPRSILLDHNATADATIGTSGTCRFHTSDSSG